MIEWCDNHVALLNADNPLYYHSDELFMYHNHIAKRCRANGWGAHYWICKIRRNSPKLMIFTRINHRTRVLELDFREGWPTFAATPNALAKNRQRCNWNHDKKKTFCFHIQRSRNMISRKKKRRRRRVFSCLGEESKIQIDCHWKNNDLKSSVRLLEKRWIIPSTMFERLTRQKRDRAKKRVESSSFMFKSQRIVLNSTYTE